MRTVIGQTCRLGRSVVDTCESSGLNNSLRSRTRESAALRHHFAIGGDMNEPGGSLRQTNHGFKPHKCEKVRLSGKITADSHCMHRGKRMCSINHCSRLSAQHWHCSTRGVYTPPVFLSPPGIQGGPDDSAQALIS